MLDAYNQRILVFLNEHRSSLEDLFDMEEHELCFGILELLQEHELTEEQGGPLDPRKIQWEELAYAITVDPVLTFSGAPTPPQTYPLDYKRVQAAYDRWQTLGNDVDDTPDAPKEDPYLLPKVIAWAGIVLFLVWALKDIWS